jgi:hypothetical protein
MSRGQRPTRTRRSSFRADGQRHGDDSNTGAGLPWSRQETWVYSGEFFDADGVVSFAAAINDQWILRIDGVTVLQGGSNNSTANNMRASHVLTLGPGQGNGWHTIDVRFNQGDAPAGPTSGVPFSFAPGARSAAPLPTTPA